MDGEPVQLVAVGFLLHPAGVADQGLQIVVGNGLLLVAEGLEPDEEGSQLLLAQLVAQLLEPGLEGVVAGVLAQHQVVGTDAHGFRREDFIGLLIGQDAVLVDAALVEEGILAHDGLVQGRGLADDIIDGLAGAVNLGGVDAGGGVEDIGAGAQGHDHLFERGVAGPLAQAVDGAFDLGRAALDAGQGVGHGQAQVIVAVDRELDVPGLLHVLQDVGDQGLHLGGGGVAHGVGEVDHGRAVLNGDPDHLGQELQIGAGGVLGGKLHVRGILLGVGRHGGSPLQDLLGGHLQLVLHVEGAGGDEQVNPRVGGVLDGLPGGVDVLLGGPGQRGHGAVLYLPGDGLDRLKVAGRGDGKAGLDDVHLELFQALSHLQLFLEVHAAARGLLAVPEGGVENFNSLHIAPRITPAKLRPCRRRRPAWRTAAGSRT